MWKLNNPVALVRAALDPAAVLTNLHTDKDPDGALLVMDLKIKEGDTLKVALFARNHLPAWVRWSIRKTISGSSP